MCGCRIPSQRKSPTSRQDLQKGWLRKWKEDGERQRLITQLQGKASQVKGLAENIGNDRVFSDAAGGPDALGEDAKLSRKRKREGELFSEIEEMAAMVKKLKGEEGRATNREESRVW